VYDVFGSHYFVLIGSVDVMNESIATAQTLISTSPPFPTVSLSKMLLSVDGHAAKQQAVNHLLQALQITFARQVFLRVFY